MKRIENDSLGPVELPQDALYGPQTQRAIDNFSFSPRSMPVTFIQMLARIKKAAAQSNGELGCIAKAQSEAIMQAADQIIEGNYLQEFPVNVFQTGSGTSTNMNMNEVLANLANKALPENKIHPNDQVNYGQSSNDVIPTCVQLSSAEQVARQLLPALDRLCEQLEELADQYQEVIKTGRTHLMDALPLSLGSEFKTWQFQVKESQRRIQAALMAQCQVPIGGTAIGTGVNTHAQFSAMTCRYLADELKLPIKPCENLAAKIASQDTSLALHSQLKVLATVLTKVCNDIRWMNSGPQTGLNEIKLKALQPGSSIMPGKVNPVIAEAVLMMCAEVMGNDTTMSFANASGNFQLNVMLPLMADKLLSSIQLLSDAANAMTNKLLLDFSVNQSLLLEKALLNPILATALNTQIGYEMTAKIIKAALEQERKIIDVAQEMTELTRDELEVLLDPKKLAGLID
ncbi:class II fumarate hydratase [Aliikangiella sp. IMCC44653]